jgi:UDP-glucose 4-epimerase
MTRFMLDIGDAIDLIEVALDFTGVNVIPVAKSFKIKDLFEIYQKEFGLVYNIGKPRISEKIHEIMISKEELPRVSEQSGYYFMDYKHVFNEVKLVNDEYSSKDYCCSKEELDKFLKKHDYFRS